MKTVLLFFVVLVVVVGLGEGLTRGLGWRWVVLVNGLDIGSLELLIFRYREF